MAGDIQRTGIVGKAIPGLLGQGLGRIYKGRAKFIGLSAGTRAKEREVGGISVLVCVVVHGQSMVQFLQTLDRGRLVGAHLFANDGGNSYGCNNRQDRNGNNHQNCAHDQPNRLGAGFGRSRRRKQRRRKVAAGANGGDCTHIRATYHAEPLLILRCLAALWTKPHFLAPRTEVLAHFQTVSS